MSHVLNCTGHELRLPNIVDSDGAYLIDDVGNRFLDLESGVWCTPLGHKNVRVNASPEINLVRNISESPFSSPCRGAGWPLPGHDSRVEAASHPSEG